MSHDNLPAPLEPVADGSLDQLETRVQARLSGRIRNLRLLLHGCGIILRGFYAKQLAQHAIVTEARFPILANEIEVC